MPIMRFLNPSRKSICDKKCKLKIHAHYGKQFFLNENNFNQEEQTLQWFAKCGDFPYQRILVIGVKFITIIDLASKDKNISN
jgi:hypothetical protein